MTALLTNATFQPKAVVSENLANSVVTQKAQEQLDPELIRMCLGVAPEMQHIDDLLDSKCYSLHKDEELNLFSDLFKEIIRTNNELFSSRTPQESADILFGFHVDTITHQLLHSKKLNSILETFLRSIKSSSKDTEVKKVVLLEIEEMLKKRISYLHSSYAHFAIANALGVRIADITSPSYKNGSKLEGKLIKPSNISMYTETSSIPL